VTPANNLPKVSALMGAYNYARFIAESIESAMEQDYPAERLELVIVDDGSTDNTAEIVAGYIERYPGRIKFVQQGNAGATAATNRARAEATGDLMALLDADDIWLKDKTRKQVDLMLQRPELGLVWSRMRLIDADGATLHEQYGHREPMPENQFARVLWENVAVQSALMIKADLFDQMPPEAPYADWWLTLRAAQFAKIDYLQEDLVLYRWHGANITGGVGGVKALREGQKGIGFQRWVIRNFALSELTHRLGPEDVGYVWTGLENQAKKGLDGLGSHFGVLATVTEEDREDARVSAEAAERAAADGDMRAACALSLRARACDPYDADLRTAFEQMIARGKEAAKLPDPLAGSSEFVVLVDAAFLLTEDQHLREYAQAMHGVTYATLVIDASAMEPAAAGAELEALVQRCGLADDDSIAMIGIVGELHPSQRFAVNQGTKARYGSACSDDHEATGVTSFTPGKLSELRELAERWQRERRSS
jgi:glycosyltransferase involved in cell wall biosynthesis